MYIDFSSLFHQSSKDRSGQGKVNIPNNRAEWPEAWKTLFYKEYPRMQKVSLPNELTDDEFFSTVTRRKTERDFSGRSIGLEDISKLLKYSCGITHSDSAEYHRAQPSGGGRYPIEVYPILFVPAEGLRTGVYHYNVREHALDSLWQRDFSKKDIAEMFTYPWAQNATCALELTGVFQRNQMKYGERGYRQILIEAGAIVQNMYLGAATLGLKCCAIDGVRETNIEKALDIDGISESVIVSVVLG